MAARHTLGPARGCERLGPYPARSPKPRAWVRHCADETENAPQKHRPPPEIMLAADGELDHIGNLHRSKRPQTDALLTYLRWRTRMAKKQAGERQTQQHTSWVARCGMELPRNRSQRRRVDVF